MEREVAWYGTHGLPTEVTAPARRWRRYKRGLPMEVTAPAHCRHGRVTWYRLLGYFLTGLIGKHPVKNS